ncbi:sodium-dependent transporter [Shewanella baltica]|uniref:sodium-dependent transporter n=1 Tax=Shewanella baltica TaxID=62322 RepID=UPI0028724C0B|nr:sodium-dependent transporter [Shewanella baltica]MDR9767731.1 sodium-dependent transporter [Shewanella baltica]
MQSANTSSTNHFSSRLGFIMAAAGSAVGVGNIWGFPTQAATHGGGAFLLVYLVLIFILGIPMLMAELMIGRHGQTNPADAMGKLGFNTLTRGLGKAIGLISIVTAGLIYTFYSILSGWFVSYAIAPIATALGSNDTAAWLVDFSLSRNLVFTLIFSTLVFLVLLQGVQEGIEKWSKRLMPLLLIMLIAGVAYIFTLNGASEGITALLTPNFTKALAPDTLISALGQTFFSLTIGTGAMMVYGSYLSQKENIAKLTVWVAFTDSGIAFLAAFLIIPAMYVAQHNGVEIFNAEGKLLDSDALVFTVLPALFSTLGDTANLIISVVFFILLIIAGLTSAISIAEVPTSYVMQKFGLSRQRATLVIGLLLTSLSLLLAVFFETLFSFTIMLTTQIAQPLVALGIAIYLGWIWRQTQLLKAIRGQDGVDTAGLFWRIWPRYVKYVCPVLIIAIAIRQFV